VFFVVRLSPCTPCGTLKEEYVAEFEVIWRC
jgi:hypothetical protein